MSCPYLSSKRCNFMSRFTLYGATNIVAWGTRLLAHHPASLGRRVVEQATGQLASRLPGSGGRVTAARHQQVALKMLRKCLPDPQRAGDRVAPPNQV
jgi:hypothetical protein